MLTRRAPAVGLVAAAWAPALVAAVVLAGRGGLDASAVVRALVGALVWAPVAAALLATRHRGPALLAAVVAVASGWVALAGAVSTDPVTHAPWLVRAVTVAAALAVPALALLVGRARPTGADRWALALLAVALLAPGWPGDAAFLLAHALLPVAVLAALGPVDRLWLRCACGAGTFAGAVVPYGVVYALAMVPGASEPIAGGLAAAVFALAFTLGDGVRQRRAARAVLGPAGDPADLLARLGEHLALLGGADGGRPTGSPSLAGLADAVRVTLGLASVTIEPGGPGDAAGGAVTVGARGRHEVAVELRSSRRRVGRLVVTGDDAGVLRRDVEPLLGRVSGLVGVSVVLAGLNAEIAEMRERVLDARDEERAILRAQLEEGIVPALTAIDEGLAEVRRRTDDDPHAARAGVAALRARVDRSVDDVRALARSLLPAALDEGDLDGALREVVRRHGTPENPHEVRAAGTDVLVSGTQLAVYLLVTDLLEDHRGSPAAGALDLHVLVGEREVAVRALAREPGAAVAGSRRALVRRAAELGAAVRPVGGPRPGVELVVPR